MGKMMFAHTFHFYQAMRGEELRSTVSTRQQANALLFTCSDGRNSRVRHRCRWLLVGLFAISGGDG